MLRPIPAVTAGLVVTGVFLFLNWQTGLPEAEPKSMLTAVTEAREPTKDLLRSVEAPVFNPETKAPLRDPKNIRSAFRKDPLGLELAEMVIGFCSHDRSITPEVEIKKDPAAAVDALVEAYFKLPAGGLYCERMFVMENFRFILESEDSRANTISVRKKLKDLSLKIISESPEKKSADCDIGLMENVAFVRFLALESDQDERIRMANLYLSKCRTQAVKDQVEEYLKRYTPDSEFGVPEPSA